MTTQLIVRPIVLSEPGSYRERRQFLRLLKRLRATSEAKDGDAVIAVLEEAEALVLSRLRTDDGSPVEDALDQISANQFDQLLSAIAFETGVGEASTVPSKDGTVASQEPSLPSG